MPKTLREEEGGSRIQRETRLNPDLQEGSRRNPMAWALVAALTALIEDMGDMPDYRRGLLERARNLICATYNIPLPRSPIGEVAVAHQLSEMDDEDIEDTI